MADPLSGLRSRAAAVKLMARKEDVPRYRWATVTSAGSPPEVVLEDDLTGAPRKVTASAIGPVQVGWRVRVERVRRNLTIVAAPAAITALTSRVAALESAGAWTACTLGSGFTGTASVRKLTPTLAEFRASLSGSFADGNTGSLCTLPAGFVPIGGEPRVGAYLAGAHPGMCYLGTSGIVGVNQRSGATRATLDARGTYGLG